MSKPNNCQISVVTWAESQASLSEIRQQVFIIEQNVPEPLEWDGLDDTAIHLLAKDESNAIACARILDGGTIGRMAVLAQYRGLGVGRGLLQQAIEVCKQHGWFNISLSAQTHAIPFYQSAGFIVSSGEYLDANIAHVDMQLNLFHKSKL